MTSLETKKEEDRSHKGKLTVRLASRSRTYGTIFLALNASSGLILGNGQEYKYSSTMASLPPDDAQLFSPTALSAQFFVALISPR